MPVTSPREMPMVPIISRIKPRAANYQLWRAAKKRGLKTLNESLGPEPVDPFFPQTVFFPASQDLLDFVADIAQGFDVGGVPFFEANQEAGLGCVNDVAALAGF